MNIAAKGRAILARSIRHHEDIATLRAAMSTDEPCDLTDYEIYELYAWFSDYLYAAGWMTGPLTDEFCAWIMEPLEEREPREEAAAFGDGT